MARPLPCSDEDAREARLAAAQRRAVELAQAAAQQRREVAQTLAFPLAHGTWLPEHGAEQEDGDDPR